MGETAHQTQSGPRVGWAVLGLVGGILWLALLASGAEPFRVSTLCYGLPMNTFGTCQVPAIHRRSVVRPLAWLSVSLALACIVLHTAKWTIGYDL